MTFASPAVPSNKLALWELFCARHAIAQSAVPLFDCDVQGRAVAVPFGQNRRLVLRRSAAMEALLVRQVERVMADPSTGGLGLEGVLYMMHWRDSAGRVLPLYIGRAGKYGKGHGNLSANLVSIRTNTGKFARWGSNYAYHIGDLSAAACPGHDAGRCSPKYRRWAARLFVDAPSLAPAPREPVWFWATAWGPQSHSIWADFEPCSLAFQEYLLIGVASELFSGVLLNEEGVNRPGPAPSQTHADADL